MNTAIWPRVRESLGQYSPPPHPDVIPSWAIFCTMVFKVDATGTETVLQTFLGPDQARATSSNRCRRSLSGFIGSGWYLSIDPDGRAEIQQGTIHVAFIDQRLSLTSIPVGSSRYVEAAQDN